MELLLWMSKAHHIKLQSVLSAFQVLLGTIVRRSRRFMEPPKAHLDAVYGIGLGMITSVGGVGTGSCSGSARARGWWHLPVLWSERNPRAQGFLAALKLLPAVSSEAGASQLLPSTVLAVLGASAPSSCQFGLGDKLGVVGLSGDSTVLTESGHQLAPQGRGNEIVLSYETLTEASLLINFIIFFNNKVSLTSCLFPECPGWIFQCHRKCNSEAGDSGICWVPQCLCTPWWRRNQIKWPQNIFYDLPV